MKKALIALYIAAVFTISIFARAEGIESNKVELLGARYTLSADLENIQIQGRYPNICTNGAQYDVAVIDGKVVVQVIANRPQGMCAAVLGGIYTLTVPLGAVKEQLKAHSLIDVGTYTVISGDGKFSVDVDFSKVQGAPGGFLSVKMMVQANSQGTPAISMGY